MKVEVMLREKVKLTTGEYSNKIIMREPTRADLKAIEHIKGELDKEDLLISRLTDISLSEMDGVVFEDSYKLQDAVRQFIGDSYDPKIIGG